MSLNTSKLPSVKLPGASGRKSELRAQDRDRKDIEDADLPAADYDIPSTLEALSDDELYELSQHEVVIQRGLKAFFEVGEALLAIRKKRLYRQTYHTFVEYCIQRWGFTDDRAQQLMRGSEAYAALRTPTIVGVLPTNEAQVRPLTKLETPEEQQAAWQKAVDTAPGGKVTGAHVAAVVDGMKPRPPVVEAPETRAVPEPPLQETALQVGMTVVTNKGETGKVVKVIGLGAHVKTASGTKWYYEREVKVVDENEAADDYVPEVEEVQVETAGEADPKPVVATVGAMVQTPSGHIGRVVSLIGRSAGVLTVNGSRQYDITRLTVIENEEEAISEAQFAAPIEIGAGLAAAIRDASEQSSSFDYKRDGKTNRAADEYVAQGYDACLTPAYALEPLFPYLGWSMPSTIWEPAAGENHLVDALFDGGWKEKNVIGTDILTGQNFFEYEPAQWDIIVTNPPYSLKFRWMQRCYELGKPFALLLPVETLGAKTAQDLMQQYGFEMMLLDSRVDFKMPNKGWDGAGSQFPVMWFCWHLLPEKVMFGSISEAKKAFKP